MGSASKIGLAVVLIAAIGLCVWGVVRSVGQEEAPKPVLGWKCSKCGEQFEAEREGDLSSAFSESDAFPQRTCPKCQGVAYRLAPYRCTKCDHEFALWLAPDPKTGRGPTYKCPKCGNRQIAPATAPQAN